MKIETKFDVGDEVWWVDPIFKTIQQVDIRNIRLYVDDEGCTTTTYIRYPNEDMEIEDMFTDIKEAEARVKELNEGGSDGE